MENTHEGHLTHTSLHDLKTDKRLQGSNFPHFEEKKIKDQLENPAIAEKDLKQHYSYIPTNRTCFSLNQTGQEDESVVSSTTNELHTKSDSSPLCEEKLHQKSRLRRRAGKITETAAATSTTSCEDDEDRLQMRKSKSKRGGVNEGRPPSCGSPSSAMKEIQPSSTTTDPEYKRNKNHSQTRRKTDKQKDVEFLKPADVPPHPTSSSSSTHPASFGHSANIDGQGIDRRDGFPFFTPHIPVDSQLRDGRYPFDPRQMQMHTGQGTNRSPLLSDISLIPLSPQPLPGIVSSSPFHPNSSLEFYMNGIQSPTMSMLSQARNLSPRHSIPDLEKMNYPFCGPGSMLPSGSGMQGHMPSLPAGFPAQGMNLAYYQFMQQQKILAMSLEKQEELGRFSSPLCRSRARKRPLSISPAFSDNLNITAMIRTSPNSLLPFANGGLSQSRSSSVASGGSYGHLAAGGISPSGYLSGCNTPMMTSPHQLQFLSRQMSLPGHIGSGFPTTHFNGTVDTASAGMIHPLHQAAGSSRNLQSHVGAHLPAKHQDNLRVHSLHDNKNSTKSVSEFSNPSHPYNNNTNNNIGVSPASHTGNDDNDAVYETNCSWENCTLQFDTQEQLVHHINNDHIHGDKKEFVCRWKNCTRDQRPFKAQYMLVVHMRRHTGEKPHRCNFQGCSKAYSRLENLKTHVRSHTGEKPYMCEYPNCTKAFSNASDRAKHQNRTHSNEKPYVCKIPGCTKRYTDPSSLRKHVKTVHGPEAHVTKRMRATKEREERTTEINVKQEPGSDKDKKKNENNDQKRSCYSVTHQSGPPSNDTNPSSNMNPRSNPSSYTSGSETTPQNSPHMTSQNNDSGVDVNVGGNDGDSDGDIVVDENPLPDSTSGGAGGVGLQARRRGGVRTSLVSRHVNKKMATLSLGGSVEPFGDYPSPYIEGSFSSSDKNAKLGIVGGGFTEVSSTTANAKMQKMKNKVILNNGTLPNRRQVAIMNQDRRDSGTASDASRKSSMASQSSRRTSQISNAGFNLAGSYDPISLDSSRRSSSNSVGSAMHQRSGSNPNAAPGLNQVDLHMLKVKYNEMAGLPPPTPISWESNSKHQHSTWTKDDDFHRVPSCHGDNYQRFPPTPPSMGPPRPPGDQMVRRRSDGAYARSMRTPQPLEPSAHPMRRASDPIKGSSQVDPGKLPSIQRYDSWNNMTPLPCIRSRNSNQAHSSNYNSMHQRQMPQRASSYGNIMTSEKDYNHRASNMVLNQQHQMPMQQFSPRNYSPYIGTNERMLTNNINAHVSMARQPSVNTASRHPLNYDEAMSPASNVMSPHYNNELTQANVTPQTSYPVVNTPRPYPNQQQPTMHGYHQPPMARQGRGYDSAAVNINSIVMSHNNTQNASHESNQHAMMMQQNMVAERMNQHFSRAHYFGHGQAMPYAYNDQMPPTAYDQAMHRQSLQNQVQSPGQTFAPPTSLYQNQAQANVRVQHALNGVDPSLTPRPPSNSSGANQNRMRLARLRHPGASPMTSQPPASTSRADNNTSQPLPSNRINYTPDAQIPDELLQQEFIDSIPELQPETINVNNETSSYVKMAADSTTGPEGDNDDDDDAMSGTNTDVTLPPMSAFSSRLATPLLNKPFPPQHPLAGSQHPASNMAINSMSSMLSTLEEENKYLNMIPPQ